MTPEKAPIAWDVGVEGVDLIAAERLRQVDEEGWTPYHDDEHTEGELASAAAVYAIPRGKYVNEDDRMLIWPWEYAWYKPTPYNRIGELAKAGALIAAEIDRLLRVEASARTISVSVEQAEAALRATAAVTTDPAVERRLSKFLRLVDWARSDG